MIETTVLTNPDEVADVAAQLVVASANEAIARAGRFVIALSGGSTPRRLHERLASASWRQQIDWSKVEIFWGDERAVPPDHPDSNFRMANESLLQPLAIAAERIHRMPAERSDLDAAARDYQAEIARISGVDPTATPPPLDLILLGLGPDAHTASLFPHSPAVTEQERWVVSNPGPANKGMRLTLTLPIINQARSVIFLVVGADKADALAKISASSGNDVERLPASGVRPTNGSIHWLVDQAAAGKATGS